MVSEIGISYFGAAIVSRIKFLSAKLSEFRNLSSPLVSGIGWQILSPALYHTQPNDNLPVFTQL